MGNAFFRVFQACHCLASAFSIARCFPCGKLGWCQIPQTAVRAFVVILRPPRCDLAPGVEQILKPTHVQTLFPQPRVKALHPSVLRRLPRLDVKQFDLLLHAPRQKMPAGKLRPVVAADRTRLTSLRHDRLQHTRHPPAGETRIHFESQTFSRIGIYHAQHPDRSSALHRIVHKIQRPLLVRRGPRQQRLSHADAMLPFLPPQTQSRLSIHPMDTLVVHRFSRAKQQHMQPPITEARLLSR